jgi:tripartite-type tricarboxylate transporter receptor subunit TctC
MLKRRNLLACGASALMLATGLPWAAQAQDNWPSRPIRMVVPFPAGGPTDITARVIGQGLSEALKVSVVVENKAGAHGFIGAADAARSEPDGYTLMMASIGTMAINPRLYDKMPYDPNKDFDPVSLVLTVPIIVVANTDKLPVDDMPGLVDYLKANPEEVFYASAGTGGSSHLVAEYFKFKTGTNMTHVPYKGSSPAISDVVAGQEQIMFDTLLTSTAFVQSNKLRMLGVATQQRLHDYPDVPTIAEALNLPDFDASSWYGIYAPAGTPAPIVQRINAAIDEILKQPDMVKRFDDLGALPVGGPPEKLASFQKAEQEKWGAVIKAANIQPD